MLKEIILPIMAGTILLNCQQCYGNSKVQLSEAELNAKLSALKPLPKVHYSWTPPPKLLEDRNNQRLYELARIMHSLSLSGIWATKQQVDNCVYTCARLNRTEPSIRSSLAFNFSPWHSKFDKNLPPTDRGASYEEEIRFFEERAKLVSDWVAQSNENYHSDVKISAILLDCERFHVLPDNEKWNEAIRENLDIIHTKTQAIFPEARIEWYGRGMIQVANDKVWDKTGYWTGKEIKAPLSCSFYTVPEIESMRERFSRTCKLADQMGISDVTPYVALAAGYRRGLDGTYFDFNWSYDIIYSYLIGAELNIKWYGDRPERFAPYNRAKVVSFYPPPFDERSPDWAIYFIAYVRGATGVKELKDLGYEGPRDETKKNL
ncbi:MAG: hypothetical protein WAK60_07525 [Sedimentisphaerales bacterium]